MATWASIDRAFEVEVLPAKHRLPIIAALSFHKNKPFHLKLSLVANLSKKAVRLWSKRSIAKGSLVFSDALQGFQAIARPGVQHKSVNISEDSQAKDRLFSAIHTVMGNLKRYILGILMPSGKSH